MIQVGHEVPDSPNHCDANQGNPMLPRQTMVPTPVQQSSPGNLNPGSRRQSASAVSTNVPSFGPVRCIVGRCQPCGHLPSPRASRGEALRHTRSTSSRTIPTRGKMYPQSFHGAAYSSSAVTALFPASGRKVRFSRCDLLHLVPVPQLAHEEQPEEITVIG